MLSLTVDIKERVYIGDGWIEPLSQDRNKVTFEINSPSAFPCQTEKRTFREWDCISFGPVAYIKLISVVGNQGRLQMGFQFPRHVAITREGAKKQ